MICEYELPLIEEVLSNNPFFKKTVADSQRNFTEFGDGVGQVERGITQLLDSGNRYSQDVLDMCSALDTVGGVLDNELYSTSLQKFSEGLSKIETYREMLLTQTQVLTLEPLKQIGAESIALTTLYSDVERSEELVNSMIERCSSCKLSDVDSSLYTKLCDETLDMRREQYLKQLNYINTLRANLTNTKLKFVQRFLEQMLAQFSFANFAYMVMREMEPYLTELFETLQNIQRVNAEQSLNDSTAVEEVKDEIESWYSEEKILTASLMPNSQTTKSSPFRNLLSFAVPGNKVSPRVSPVELNLNQNSSPKTSPSSSPTLSSDRSPACQRREFTPIPQTPKSRSNPFNKKTDDLIDDFPDIVTEDYSLISEAEILECDSLSHSAEDLRENTLVVEEIRRSSSDVDLTTFHEDTTRQRSKTDTISKRRSQLIKLDSLQRMRKSDKKQGYLYVRQKGTLGYRWVLMYCIVESDHLKGWVQDKEDKMIELEHLPTTTIKPTGAEVDRNSCFYMVSPKGKRCYQAFTELDRRNWIRALTHSSVLALQRKNTLDGQHIERLYRIAGNDVCADCTDLKPEWACIDHGITICIKCSGVHRSLGVNVSKVRSIYLDNWSEQVLLHMDSKGNELFNELYERNVQVKIDKDCDKDARLSYIKSKYIDKTFTDAAGDVPGPAVEVPLPPEDDDKESFVEDVASESSDFGRPGTRNIKSEENSAVIPTT